MNLVRLARDFLAPYRAAVWAIIGLQLVNVVGMLYLPSLNADIIDKGVVTGNTDYIWHTGGIMLAVTFGQALFAIAAVYFGARAAMAFGRDVRDALFHRVTEFSAQDVATFGSASLITRITNDVTQVQTLVVMICTLFVAAPITIIGGSIMAVREDGPLSLLLLAIGLAKYVFYDILFRYGLVWPVPGMPAFTQALLFTGLQVGVIGLLADLIVRRTQL